MIESASEDKAFLALPEDFYPQVYLDTQCTPDTQEEASMGLETTIIVCPHCGKASKVDPMNIWQFEQCKTNS